MVHLDSVKKSVNIAVNNASHRLNQLKKKINLNSLYHYLLTESIWWYLEHTAYVLDTYSTYLFLLANMAILFENIVE